MTDILITMDSSGSFSFSGTAGRIEEYCAKRLKIRLSSDFISSAIKYYTLSFEPFSLSRKIITENIYVNSDSYDGIYYTNGYIYCPIYDYMAVSPNVMVQIDAYETDSLGNVKSIIKSGIFTLEFSESLTGEGVMLETTRPDVRFAENVKTVVNETLENYEIDGANIKRLSVDGSKIKVLSISSSHLMDLSVTSNKIAKGAVDTESLADENITTEKLKDGCVSKPKIADAAVTTEKIADKSVTSAKIAEASISGTKLSNFSVSEAKLRPNSVSTSKIVDGAVTPAKLDRTYLTHHQSLTGYATQDWVKKQNYITDISMKADREELPEKLSDLKNDIAVSFVEQTLTATQKDTALKNIGAVKAENGKTLSSNDFTDEDKEKLSNALTQHQDISMKADRSELPEKLSELENDIAVTFNRQSLTQEQKNTVLENISAVKAEEGKVLSANDFTDEDKEKLSLALTEHQDISMKADKDSLSTVAFSGSYNDLENLPDLDKLKEVFTDEMKTQYDSAYEHSLSEHAPAEAQENTIEKIILNGKETEIKDKQVAFSTIEYTVYGPVFTEV